MASQSIASYSHYPDYIISTPAPFVLEVLINRPLKHNAFTGRMWHHLGEVFDQISLDPEVRAVVLAGSGANFSVGLDMIEASQGEILNGHQPNTEPARRAQTIRRYILGFQHCVSSVQRCAKPVVCVLHGISYGISIDIASCADIRVCAEDTRFSVKEVDIGIAADLGSLSRLPKIVGNLGWVKDVCLTAREFNASEAMRVGLVNEVLHTKAIALEKGLDIATVLVEKSPLAVQGTKEIVNHAVDHSIDESLVYTGVWNSSALQTKDVSEAVGAWKAKGRPTFEKL